MANPVQLIITLSRNPRNFYLAMIRLAPLDDARQTLRPGRAVRGFYATAAAAMTQATIEAERVFPGEFIRDETQITISFTFQQTPNTPA